MSDLAYFRTRLAAAQKATELPASARYDLAMSTLDDDALEESAALFGGPPAGSSGFGISEITTELMSRDPKYFPVEDLKQHQESLVAMGYARGVEPDGNWSPYWGSASRRADRDSLDLVRSGQHWGATTTKKFFEFINYTYTPNMIRGVIGAAKGMVQQFADLDPIKAAEEGGAAGGAALGAGTGAIIGSVVPGLGTAVGAGVGAVVGGAAGFFSDFFDDDEDEEGTWEKIIGALSPYEEIKSGDAKNLFNAFSVVMTASAVGKGAQLAVQGVKGTLAAGTVVGGRSAGGMVLPQVTTVSKAGLREAFRRAAPGTFDKGIINKAMTAAVNRPIVGSAAIGGGIDAFPELLQGDYGGAVKDFARGAAIGAVVGPRVPANLRTKALKGLEAAPFRRVTESAAGQISRHIFTGASTAQIGARALGGIGGEADIVDPKTGEVLEDRPGTAIAEAIEDAPEIKLPGPVEFALGAVLYPNRLLPLAPRDVGRALSSLSSNNELIPFAEAARRVVDPTTRQTKLLSLSKGMERAREMMGRAPDGSYDESLVGLRATYSYLTKGIDDAAERAIRGQSFDNQFIREAQKSQARSRIVRTMFTEAGKSADQAPDAANLIDLSPTAKKLLDEAKSNPMAMRNHIEQFEGRGSTLESFAQHQEASEFLQRRTGEIGLSRKAVKVGAVADDATPGALDTETPDPFGKVGDGHLLTPALRDDPTKGITGYQTRQHFEQVAAEYEEAATQFKQASDAALDAAPDSILHVSRSRAAERLDSVLSEARRRGMVDDSRFHSLRPLQGEPQVSQTFIKELQDTAKVRPREVTEVSEELANNGLGRYIALETPEQMLFYDQVPKLLEVQGVREYARRKPFFDLLGSLSTKVEDADLGRMRFNSINAEVDSVAAELNLGMDGKTITNKIYNELRVRYDPEYAMRARGEQLSTSFGVIVKRTDAETGKASKELFKLDPRDLTPDDILDALKLEDIENLDDPFEAANKIKRALHVGAAFGADAMKAPLHPIQQARAVGRAMKVTGLPGFNDFMRTAHVPQLQKMFPKNSYGYLPQNLHRASMALRYSLSPQFDAGRYMEQASFGAMKGQIPPAATFAPRRFLEGREWKSPYSAAPVTGEEAVKHAMKFYDDEILGRVVHQNFDELQMRLMHKGILGFSPRQSEAAQAFYLYNQKLGRGIRGAEASEQIRNTIYEIGRYGTGQTPLAKSAHFIMFPYLFQAKQLRALEDFVFGAPLRNVMIHEGMRRWYGVNSEEGLGESFSQYMKKHVPLASEVGRLNNLSYGIGPGRFFLEGLMDREQQGKVVQGLSAFFVPGGSNQPMHEFLGGTADALKHLFVPVVMFDTDGSRLSGTDEMLKMAERLAPAYRDMQRWFDENDSPIRAQLAAVTEGAAPFEQYRDYMEVRGQMGVTLENAAKQAGFASWDSLRASPAGAPIAQMTEEIDRSLGEEFPSGAELASRFTNRESVVDQALWDLARKEDRTGAEEAILMLGTSRETVKMMAAQTGRTQEEMLRVAAPVLRSVALEFIDNRQFMNLYEAMFESELGPIRQVSTA